MSGSARHIHAFEARGGRTHSRSRAGADRRQFCASPSRCGRDRRQFRASYSRSETARRQFHAIPCQALPLRERAVNGAMPLDYTGA